METLRSYLNALPTADQEAYAARCGTTLGYLRKAISTNPRPDVELVIALERESGGEVPCEDIRPDVDWAYLRGSACNGLRSTNSQ
jgi:DNA-binding transcriptional regulator YdaS (Cro superfamily)